MLIRARALRMIAPAVAALVCAGCDPAPATSGTSAPVVAPATRVVAPGRLWPEGGIVRVGPSVDLGTGSIGALYVAEGAWVHAGDRLATLRSHASMAAEVLRAQAALRLAEARLARATGGAPAALVEERANETAALKADKEKAQLDAQRAQALRERGFTSTALEQRAALEAERAEALWRQSVAGQRTAALAREDELRLARAELAQAGAQLERAKADLEQTVVRAPSDGKVLRILTRAGEQIGPQGVLELADTRATVAVAEVFVNDLPRVAPGMTAQVQGGPLAQPVLGVVSRISPVAGPRRIEGVDADSLRGERVSEVWVRLPCALESGFNAVVRLEISTEAPARSVPTDAPARC